MTLKRASDLVAERVKDARQQRNWTAEDLAARCAEIGAPEITRSVIANIETGRRDEHGRRRRAVTVEELLSLAYALELPPVLLLSPLGGDETLEVAAGVDLGALDAAAWIADDDAILGLGREVIVLGEDSEFISRRQQGRARAPLTLVRLIRVLARAIRIRDRRLSSEVYRRQYESFLKEDERALAIYGMRLRHLEEWLASLGYPTPVLPDVTEILRRRNVPDVSLAADPFGEAPGEDVYDPAIDALQESEVAGGDPRT